MTRSSRRLRLLTSALGLLALTTVVVAASVFTDLGATEDDARDAIFNNLTSGSVYFPGKKAVFKSASGEARAAMVRAVATFGKAYVQSDLFKKRYANYRDSNRATPPTPKSADAELAKQKQDMEKGIKNLEETLKKMPPDQQKDMQDLVKQMKDQMASLDSPQQKKMMTDGINMQNASDQQQYEQRLKKFDADYPADINLLVARRLQEFLDLSATVNFDAKLKNGWGFVDQKYEDESGDWKVCYRAGKPAVDAARTFAQEWLKELKVTP